MFLCIKDGINVGGECEIAILHGTEVSSLRKMEISVFVRIRRHVVSAICVLKIVASRNINILIYILGFNEVMDQLAKANDLHWYGHVLNRKDRHSLKIAMTFEVEDH